MLKNILIIISLLFVSCDSEDSVSPENTPANYNYSLEDLNPTSSSYQESVGTSYSLNKITIHYFGHYSWGTCSARFEQLNNLYESLLSDGYDQVKLIGIGKNSHISFLNNWTDNNNASVCADASPFPTWSDWGASQRDLFILDHSGEMVFNQNISSGIPDDLETTIVNLINEIPD